MTFLVERLAELQRYVEHARVIRGRVGNPLVLETDLTLRNDVLFTLLTIAQLVIDIAGEISGRRGERFETYRESIRNLSRDERFPQPLVTRLESLAGFRNIVVHEYVEIDPRRVIAALDDLAPVSDFIRLVASMERS
jgi:uncharacterized protein YutE (UPF0331/DUF86 family)